MKRLAQYALGFCLVGAVAIAGNLGPMMIQNRGNDLGADDKAAFWANIGGGAAGQLGLGNCTNLSGGLNCPGAVPSFNGRTGPVTLAQGDVTGALGYAPLNKGGDTLTGLLAPTNLTASAAGTTQGNGTPITAQFTVFTSVAAGAAAVLNATVGVDQTIANRGVNTLVVYPFSGAAIEAYGTNSPVAIAVGGAATFRCVSSTQCYAGL